MAIIKKNLPTHMKYCRKGLHIVERINFKSDSYTSDGLHSNCNDCNKKKNMAYYNKFKKVKWGVLTDGGSNATILRQMTRFINKARKAQIITPIGLCFLTN